MNKLNVVICVICFLMSMNGNIEAQSFGKGSLLMSLSEGSTLANYTTTNTNGKSDVLHNENMGGTRDPLTVEYGLNNRWGIGLTSGTDFYMIDPSAFYGFQTTDMVKAFMTEFTVDGYYHFLVTRKLDVSAFTSLGLSSVTFKGNSGDQAYRYNAGGLMARTGIKARYYFLCRLGVFGMASVFSDRCAADHVKGNTVGQGYTTTIKGTAMKSGCVLGF